MGYLWTAFLLVGLAGCACRDWRTHLTLVCRIRWYHVPLALGLLVVVATTATAVMVTWPVMRWSWLSLFDVPVTNINFGPVTWYGPVFGLAFLTLLIVNFPGIVLWEEKTFRAGTIGLGNALLRSVVFGFMHCLVGVPLGAGVGLTVGGLGFAAAYWWGGLAESISLHLTVNLLLGVLLWLGLCLQVMR